MAEGCCQDDLFEQVRVAAFRRLLDTGTPVDLTTLQPAIDADLAGVAGAVEELDRQGLVRRDEGGRIVGSYGLSVVPSENTIEFEGRRFWTWCAKTSLGVLAALDRGGRVVATTVDSGRQVSIDFEGSRPRDRGDVVVFWPSDDVRTSCSSVVEEFCPNFSFFETAAAAEAWSSTHAVAGEVLSLDDATDRAVGRWQPLVATAPL
jgi:Alkylmercury lyase